MKKEQKQPETVNAKDLSIDQIKAMILDKMDHIKLLENEMSTMRFEIMSRQKANSDSKRPAIAEAK